MKSNYIVISIFLLVNFSFGQIPRNDDIEDAITITDLPYIDQFVRTDRATVDSDGGMNNCDLANIFTRVYYRYVPQQDEPVVIGIHGGNPNSLVIVYESSVSNATQDSQLTLAGSISNCALGTSAEITLQAGKTYYFVIGNPDSASHVIVIPNNSPSIINIPDINFKNMLVNQEVVELDNDPNSYTFVGNLSDQIDVDINNDGEIQESEALFVTYLDVSGEFSTPDSELINDLTGIEYFTNIENINIERNNISDIDLVPQNNLKGLFCGGNTLTNIDVSSYPVLETLECWGNQLTSLDVSQNLSLQTLFCSNNQLSGIDVTQNQALISLNISVNPISTIDVSKNLLLESLTCVEGQLTDIDVSQNLELSFLWLSDNQISNLDVSRNLKLETLWMSRNNLSNIDIANNVNLKQITFWENNLTEIDVSNNVLLERMFIGYNDISNLDVTQHSNLRDLGCENLLLTDLDVSQNPNLEYFTCHSNQLTTLDVSQNSKLRNLICYSNQLTSLNVTQNPDLSTLRLGSNPIQGIDVSQNTSLEHFNSYGTSIESLDLSQNPNLNIVRVGNNYNLQSLNLKNGNNSNITSENFNAIGSPNLQTVCVDNRSYAVSTFTAVEPLTIFVEDCQQNTVDYNIIEGVVRLDENTNGCGVDDSLIPNLRLTTTDGTNEFSTFTDDNGFYRLATTENTYTTSLTSLPSFVDASPMSSEVTFNSFGNTEVLDFCLTANNNAINDLEVIIFPVSEARPGFEAKYQVVYQNKGITTLSGSVTFQFDDLKQSFTSAMPTETSEQSDSVTFDFTDLKPFESRSVDITMTTFTPPAVNGDEILSFIAEISSNSSDQSPENNIYQLNQLVVNSYDPNDKLVLQGENIFMDQVDDYLDYVVRFQNTGTASAINVRITDRLSDQLDWNTLEPISASHEYRIKITNGDFVEFIFENIDLPAEQTDLEGSNGFIAFRIKPKTSVTVGDIISGEADIYFDFNPPIITNTVNTEVVDLLDIAEYDVTVKSIVLYPNPSKDWVTISSHNLIKSIAIIDINGRLLRRIDTENSKTELLVDIDDLVSGIYFLEIQTSSEKRTVKMVKN